MDNATTGFGGSSFTCVTEQPVATEPSASSTFVPESQEAPTSAAPGGADHRCAARIRSLGRLPNHLILTELLRLHRQEWAFNAELLLFLGELDHRKLYREHAVASAFEFCVARLGYSEEVAYKRVGAARLMRQFPAIYRLVAEGRIHLTALMLLKAHLTENNHEQWLIAACGKSKRQVEKMIAVRCPRPDVPARIRRLPGASPVRVGDTSTRALTRNLQDAARDLVVPARGETAEATTETTTEATTQVEAAPPSGGKRGHVTRMGGFTPADELAEGLVPDMGALARTAVPAEVAAQKAAGIPTSRVIDGAQRQESTPAPRVAQPRFALTDRTALPDTTASPDTAASSPNAEVRSALQPVFGAESARKRTRMEPLSASSIESHSQSVSASRRSSIKLENWSAIAWAPMTCRDYSSAHWKPCSSGRSDVATVHRAVRFRPEHLQGCGIKRGMLLLP